MLTLKLGLLVAAATASLSMTLALAAPAPAASPPLDLTAAVKYAIEHSPTLDSTTRAAAIADLQYRNARAAFLPSLDLTGNAGFKQQKLPGQAATPTPPWTSDLNVAATETLYDNGVTITNYRIASLNADIAHINFEGARAKLALDVSTSFYNFSLNVRLLEVSRGKNLTLGKQFTQVSIQYRQGLRSRQDFLRFKAQVQQAQIDQVNAENGILTSAAALRTILGMPADAPDPQLAPSALSPIDLTRDVPSAVPALEAFYDVRAGRLQMKVNELNATFARRLWLPQVGATLGANYDNNGFIGSGQAFPTTSSLNWNGQITLTYNIWDWGTRWRNVEIAEHTQGQGDDTVTSTILGVRQSIDTLMVNLDTQAKSYRLNTELLDLSQQSYSFLEEQYRLGKIQYLDLITGLNDLLTAKTQYLNAYYGLLQALAQYRYYEGTIYERTVK